MFHLGNIHLLFSGPNPIPADPEPDTEKPKEPTPAPERIGERRVPLLSSQPLKQIDIN